MTDELIDAMSELYTKFNRVNALTRQELLDHGFPCAHLFSMTRIEK